jgi:hypothetical protein
MKAISILAALMLAGIAMADVVADYYSVSDMSGHDVYYSTATGKRIDLTNILSTVDFQVAKNDAEHSFTYWQLVNGKEYDKSCVIKLDDDFQVTNIQITANFHGTLSLGTNTYSVVGGEIIKDKP